MEAAASAGAGAGVGSDCEGEDQEDPSSSHSNDLLEAVGDLTLEDDAQVDDTEDELSAFRLQWQRELESTPSPQHTAPKKEERQPQTEEELAMQLFLKGVELERDRKLYEAIQNYKRAMQILPDVETRLYESTERRPDTPEEESEAEEPPVAGDEEHPSDDEDAVEGEELSARLHRIVLRRGYLCEPATPTNSAHMSWLPYEVVLLVLRWVVSSELDAGSLARAGAVCRGLYVAAGDPDLWRALCVKTWGIDCGVPASSGVSSWREMYIVRPRLQLHGCYISKTTYLRHGENSFQDQFYRPWYLIDYYRYLRFFPEGLVLMLTTAEEPAACVAQLKSRAARPGAGILQGHYRLIGDKVVIIIKKSHEKKVPAGGTRFRARRRDPPDHNEQVFHMELELRSSRSGRNGQLWWVQYCVSTRRDVWTPLELSAGRFPPLHFSPVRHYTAAAHQPLRMPTPTQHNYLYGTTD